MTRYSMADASVDKSDAGAPENESKIEVTPQMIEAGLGDYLDLTSSRVEGIYVAMERVRRRLVRKKHRLG